MRNMTKWLALVAVSVALVVASAATDVQGQAKGQGKGKGGFGGQFGGGGLFGGATLAQLLSNEGVQTELKMTADQKSKANDFAQEQQTKMIESFRGGGGGFDPESFAKMRTEANQAAEKYAKANLKAEQAKRLKGIYYQTAVLQFLSEDEEVQKELTITADQKTKLKAHNEKLTADRTELVGQLRGGGGDFAQMGEKLTALTKEHTDKGIAELTAAQKTKWKDMTGEPFTVQQGARGRRGGGD